MEEVERFGGTLADLQCSKSRKVYSSQEDSEGTLKDTVVVHGEGMSSNRER